MAETRSTVVVQRWDAAPWLVNWSAVWVGALAMLTVGLIFGLMGIALGAYQEARIVSWHKFQMWALVLSVCGAFFSSVVGGWTAGKILGERLAERTMLHAAIAWVLTVPMLLVLASLGAAGYFGVWYNGLAGTPVWVAPTVVADPQAAAIMARNGALGALTALLLGLVGSVVGGWMASGEPMTFTYHRTRAAFVAGGSK
jgi:uncharacterized membrane protein YeaQ/YmgE (transglycosylase-associated protein family)